MVDICVSECGVHRAEIESKSSRRGIYFGFILKIFILLMDYYFIIFL